MGVASFGWLENLSDGACGALLWSGCSHWVHSKWATGALVFLLMPFVAWLVGAVISHFRRTAVCQEEQNQAQALAKKYVEHAQSLLSSQCAADRQVAIRLLDVALRYQPSKPLALELKARTLFKLQRFEEVIWLLGRSWDEAAASAALPASKGKLSLLFSLGAFPVTLKQPGRILSATWQHIGGGACAVVTWACLWLARLLGGGGVALGPEARDSPPWRWLLTGQAWYQLGQLEIALAYLQRAREEMREEALKERHTWTHDRFPCPVAPSRPAAIPRPFHPSSSHRAGPAKGMPNEAATANRLMTAIRNMLRRKAAAEEALAGGRFTEATRHLTMVVEGPRSPPLAFGAACFVLRGSAHEACGRAMDALLDYTRAAALDPTSGGGLARRAKLLERLRCFAESALDVQKLQEVCEARAWAESRGLPNLSPIGSEGSGRGGSEGGKALPPPKQGGLAKDGNVTGGGRAGALSLSTSLLHGSPSPSLAGAGDNGTALNGCEGRWWVVSLEEAETKLAELFWRAEVQDGNDRGMDRWALLGLPCGASREEVETAHRVTALRHDPGKAGDFLDRWECLDKASLQSLRLSIRRDSTRMFRLLHRACVEVLEQLPPPPPEKKTPEANFLSPDCAKKNKRKENLATADEREESTPRTYKDNKANGNGFFNGHPPRSSSPHGLPPRPETRHRSIVGSNSTRSGHGKHRKASRGTLDNNTTNPRSIPSLSYEENALSSFSLGPPKHTAKPLPNLRQGCGEGTPEPAGGTPWLESGIPKQATSPNALQVTSSGGALGGIDHLLAKGEDKNGGSICEDEHLEKLQVVALHLASYFETQGFFFESNVCLDDAVTITERETEMKPSSPPPLHSAPSSSFHSPVSSSGGKSPRSQGERESRSTAGEFFEIGHFRGNGEDMTAGGMDSMIVKRSDLEEGKGRVHQEESIVGSRSVAEVGKETMSYPSLTICLASWDSKHSNALWFPV